jgi:hypothetical protein
MPKLKWTDIEEIKHSVSRIKQYHCENILREKVLLESIKELEERLEELILQQED